MTPQRLIKILIPVSIIFVIFGEQFLPQPLSGISRTIKQGANQFLEGLFPSYQPVNPHERTRNAVDKMEKNN
jgi:hypothetical protein